MTDFSFLSPGWLLLLPLIWGLLWAFTRFKKNQSMWRKFCTPHLLAHMVTDYPNNKDTRWQVGLLALILTLAALGLAGPSWREQSNPLLESAAARILALDLSRSMLVEDVKPNRFELAIASARKLISADFSGETGLVVYAGAAFVVSPLSRDANTLLAFLDALNPQTMPLDGSRTDLAINTSADLLSASITGSGQILLVASDVGDIDSAIEAAANARELGNRVSLLAIGTEAGGPLKNANGEIMRDASAQVILVKTEFAQMHRIAEAGGGVFAGLNTDKVSKTFANESGYVLQSLESIDDSLKTPANDGIWLVLVMLPLALLLFRKNAFWILLVGLTFPSDHKLYAMDWQTLLSHSEQRAFKAYQQGDYATAIAFSNTSLLQGSAYYRQQKYQQAFDAFSQQDSAIAFYNSGNALAHMQKFPEALIAYTKALSIDPEMANAKVNQALIKSYLAQQSNASDADSNSDEDSESAEEALQQASGLSRSGSASEQSKNPGDSQQAGFGASSQPGSFDFGDDYDGRDPQLESFNLQEASVEDLPDPAIVERWIESLPQASSELFQRKFLRDYNRQKNQAR